jgi:excinuclease ABC subunit A
MSIAQIKKQTLDLGLDSLNIEGLSHHNFKNQDLSIPHDKLVVICGLSGSGKSTLAFDTIYAEGGRRYIETFSPYTRQFLDRLPRPELKKIENVRPSLALEQRNRISSSRSTVGTTTEINDYLKVLWPNVSELHCPSCSEIVQDYSKKEVVSWVVNQLGKKEGSILPTFKVELSKKVSLAMLKETLQADGFLRLFDRKSAQVLRLDDYNPKTKPSHIEVLVDRISTSGTSLQEEAEDLERLNSSLTQAMTFGRGEYQSIRTYRR